jgi:hypothetical protein
MLRINLIKTAKDEPGRLAREFIRERESHIAKYRRWLMDRVDDSMPSSGKRWEDKFSKGTEIPLSVYEYISMLRMFRSALGRLSALTAHGPLNEKQLKELERKKLIKVGSSKRQDDTPGFIERSDKIFKNLLTTIGPSGLHEMLSEAEQQISCEGQY